MPKKTIMFTDYVFDAIRLVKVTEGKGKNYYRRRFNGEGWTHNYLSYSWDGDNEVICTSYTSARDCDGPLACTAGAFFRVFFRRTYCGYGRARQPSKKRPLNASRGRYRRPVLSDLRPLFFRA